MFEDKGFLQRPLVMLAALMLGGVALLLSNLAAVWEIYLLRMIFLVTMTFLFPFGIFALFIDLGLNAARHRLQREAEKEGVPFDEGKVTFWNFSEGEAARFLGALFGLVPIAIWFYAFDNEMARNQRELSRLLQKSDKQVEEGETMETARLRTRAMFCEELARYMDGGREASWSKEFQEREGFDCATILATKRAATTDK